jgi:phosphoribosyl-dephospho-CoA transferase
LDWSTILEPRTQVAIIGVLSGLVAAAAAVGVAIVNNRRAGGGKAEIAALTIDNSAVKLVAAALEALNMTMIEQNKLTAAGGDEVIDVVKAFTKEVEELRREVRALTDKMRGRG